MERDLIFRALAAALALSLAAAAPAEETAARAAFSQGCDAFKSGDWNSAMVILRKAVSFDENNANDGARYMLVMSEIYAGEYEQAGRDCDSFLRDFPRSPYSPYVQYQKGRALFEAGEYEQAALLLSDFCHQNPDSEMYASALYWIAESFFASCKYDEARALYERIVNEFPGDAKAPAAQFRLETIAQRAREERLLYLLKKTGEEYLAAKESYEKQLKLYSSASDASEEAAERLARLKKRNDELEAEIDAVRKADLDAIRRLKEKARKAQALIDAEAQGDAK